MSKTTNRSLVVSAVIFPLLFCILPLAAQDARQIVQESQRRGRANSERYEGVLEVIAANNKRLEEVLDLRPHRLLR